MIIIFFWLISQFFAQPITNELRIFEQANMKELLKFSFCINNIDFVREYTITGHLISLSNLLSNKEGNYTIENLYQLYDKHIILIIDDPNFFNPDIQIYVIKHMTYFSLYITDESFFPIVQTMDHVCVLESSNITSLLLYENADYMSEYYHSEFLFDQGFVYYSGLFLFLFSLINFIPKLYYIIWNINDPFQKIFFLSYILNVLLCLLVFVESKLTLEYYDKYKMPPTSSFLYYIINNVDSFLKTYTMIICIAISNGLFFAFTFRSRKLGNYFCIIACLFFFFALDFPAKGLFNKSHSKLIKDFLEMCLELKELVLFTFLIQICTKQTNIVEMQILRKILFATSLSDSYRKKIKIKMKYLKRQKIALLFFLLLFCILVIFEKSGFSYYMNGVFILLMKMYGNALLLLLLNAAYFPRNFSRDFFMFDLLNGSYYVVQIKDYYYMPPKITSVDNSFSSSESIQLQECLINHINKDDLIPGSPCLVLNPYCDNITSKEELPSHIEINFDKIKIGFVKAK